MATRVSVVKLERGLMEIERDKFFVNTKIKKVAVFCYVPRVDGQRFDRFMDWSSPENLAKEFSDAIYRASRRTYKYEIVETEIIQDCTPLENMDSWDTKTLRRLISDLNTEPYPRIVFDYGKFIRRYDVLANIADGTWDEVWIFGHPFSGLYQSTMGGPKAFWCQSPKRADTDASDRRFFIMGFDYSRGLGEMLEAFIHRAEATMYEVYRFHPPQFNMWAKFIKTDLNEMGQSAVGTAHRAPNSEKDFHFTNPTPVMSSSDDWLFNYPHLRGIRRPVSSKDWGDGDVVLHHMWWLKHLPHWPRVTNGVFNNWWHYIMTPDWVKTSGSDFQ